MFRFSNLVLVAFLLAATPAFASRSAPLVEPGQQRVTDYAGESVDAESIERAILEAAHGLNWRVLERGDGRMTLQLDVRSKHSAIVEARYEDGVFEIRYSDSVNLNYRVRKGRTMIHPNYNRWVQQLQQGIFQAVRAAHGPD